MATPLYGYSTSEDSEDSESEDETDISDLYPKPNRNLKSVVEVLEEDETTWTTWFVNYYQIVRDIQPYLKKTYIIEEAKKRVIKDLGLPQMNLNNIPVNLSAPRQTKLLIRADFDDNIIEFQPEELLQGITNKYLSDYLQEDEYGYNFNAFGPAERLFVRYIHEIALQTRDLRAYTVASESDRGNFGKLGSDIARRIKDFIGKKEPEEPKTRLRF